MDIIGQKVSSDQDVIPVTTVTLATIAAQSAAAVSTSYGVILNNVCWRLKIFSHSWHWFNRALDNLLKYARLDIKYN